MVPGRADGMFLERMAKYLAEDKLTARSILLRRYLPILLMSAVLLSGMASIAATQTPHGTNDAQNGKNFADYPVHSANGYKLSTEQGEVSVGIEPVESVDDQMTYFHTALAQRGFLAVFVVVENRSKCASLLLNKRAIHYGQADSREGTPKMDTAGEKTAVATTSVIPVIGIFIAAGIERTSMQIKQNLVLRELRSETIEPGKSAHGFIYIPIPRKGPRPKLHVEIPIAWSGSESKSEVNFEF